MIVADKYTLTFEEAIRAMLDGKYAAAEGVTTFFRFRTNDGFQYRTYNIRGDLYWSDTSLPFIDAGLPRRKWMIIDEAVFDPCPFCGSSLFSLSTHNEENGVRVQIVCKGCDSEVTLRGKDMEEICDKWNRGRK